MPETSNEKSSVELGGLKVELQSMKEKFDRELQGFTESEREKALATAWKALLELEEKQKSLDETTALQNQVLSGDVKVDVKDNHGTITIEQNNHVYNISIEGTKVDEEKPKEENRDQAQTSTEGQVAKAGEVSAEDEEAAASTTSSTNTNETVRTTTSVPASSSNTSTHTTAATVEQSTAVAGQTTVAKAEQPAAKTVEQTTETQQTTTTYTETPDAQIDTPDKAAEEIKNILASLCSEVQPDATGSIVLSAAQMGKLDRINSLRYRSFVPAMPTALAEALGGSGVITAEDLKDKKSIKAARNRLKDQLRDEKKYNKELGKLVDQYMDYINAKNSTNYNLNRIGVLSQINSALDTGVYINTPLAFLPENGPLICDLVKNYKSLKDGNRIKLQYKGQQIDIFSNASTSAARGATEYLAGCGGYSNILEKFLTEKTNMTQSQARNMVGTVGSLGLIAGAIGVGVWLFSEKEGGERKFKFPGLGKLAAAIGIPLGLKYGSEALTGKSFLENLNTWWRTGQFPWENGAQEGLSLSERLSAQQVMGQFVLLGVPFEVLAKCGTFGNDKMTKIDLEELKTYLETREQAASGEEKMRLGAQIAAIESIIRDGSQNTLNNYIERLDVKGSDIKDPNKANATLDNRLSEASEKYNKLDAYLKAKNLNINPAKKDKIVDTLFKEKDLSEKVFDKLKEEGCFLPNTPTYQELDKLQNVSVEKKIKLHDAFVKIAGEGIRYGQMNLKVDGGNLILKSGLGNDNKEIKLYANDNTIDGLVVGDGVTRLKLESEEELLRTALIVNRIRTSSVWSETPIAKGGQTERPFKVSSGWKFWGDIEFMKHSGDSNNIKVLSSFEPFFSEMAKNHPTIEKDNNREFFVKYLNKLRAEDPQTVK